MVTKQTHVQYSKKKNKEVRKKTQKRKEKDRNLPEKTRWILRGEAKDPDAFWVIFDDGWIPPPPLREEEKAGEGFKSMYCMYVCIRRKTLCNKWTKKHTDKQADWRTDSSIRVSRLYSDTFPLIMKEKGGVSGPHSHSHGYGYIYGPMHMDIWSYGWTDAEPESAHFTSLLQRDLDPPI